MLHFRLGENEAESVSVKKLAEDVNEILAVLGTESSEADVDVADAKMDENYDIENHHMIAKELEKLTKEIFEKEQMMRDSQLQQSAPESHEVRSAIVIEGNVYLSFITWFHWPSDHLIN